MNDNYEFDQSRTESKHLRPKYYRLLEKGEIIKKGDAYVQGKSLIPYNLAIGQAFAPSEIAMRPVQVDEWISYAEQKPTKEDFEPTGSIQTFWHDGTVGTTILTDLGRVCSERQSWRRITPPQPAKPKTVKLKKHNGSLIATITPMQDGRAEISCGDVITAESIKEFMQIYEEVTGQKP